MQDVRDLRVHVAGQGYEVERIVAPAIEMRADRVHLLTDRPKPELRAYYDVVLRRLKAARIDVHVRECEVWDPNAVVGEMGRIASHEAGNHIYVNLGTGPKTCAIGGMLASMLWGFEAYYPRVDYEADPVEGDQDFPVRERTSVPTFRLDPPSADVLAVLELLVEKKGRPARKKEIVERLEARHFIPETASAQSKQNAADRALKKAVEWGFIDSEGEGRRRRLTLNPRGEAGRRMFGHLPTRAGTE